MKPLTIAFTSLIGALQWCGDKIFPRRRAAMDCRAMLAPAEADLVGLNDPALDLHECGPQSLL